MPSGASHCEVARFFAPRTRFALVLASTISTFLPAPSTPSAAATDLVLPSAPNTASSRSIDPTDLPLVFLTSIFIRISEARGTSSGLDLDVHTSRKIELHQRIERLLRRLENIEQPLVRADLELLARLLVGVRRTQHAVLVDLRRQRDRTGDLGAG